MTDRRRSRHPRATADGATVHRDPVPDAVVARAKAAFDRRSSAEIATLVFDSLVEGKATVTEQRLRFEHPREQVDVLISAGETECTLRGRVQPAPVRVELELEGADVALVDDATTGDFAFAGVPHGLKRMILVGPPGSEPVLTDWFRT